MTGFRFINGLTVLSCLSLGACAAGGILGSADGDYRGTSTRYQVLRRTCPRPAPYLTLHVQGGTLLYRWDNQYIQASVRGGTVSGAAQGVQLTGTYDGTTIQAKVTDGQCGIQFTVNRGT